MAAPRIRLGHVALSAEDVDRLEGFYRDVIGLEVARRGGNNLAGRAVFFTSSPPGEEDHELVLLSHPQGAHVAFRVDSREALAAFWGRATAANLPLPIPPQDSGAAWSVFVTDPGGNKCEVYWATGLPATDPAPLNTQLLSEPATGSS